MSHGSCRQNVPAAGKFLSAAVNAESVFPINRLKTEIGGPSGFNSVMVTGDKRLPIPVAGVAHGQSPGLMP